MIVGYQPFIRKMDLIIEEFSHHRTGGLVQPLSGSGTINVAVK
jgi:hypothetical protein